MHFSTGLSRVTNLSSLLFVVLQTLKNLKKLYKIYKIITVLLIIFQIITMLGTVQKTMATTTRSMTNSKEISLKLKNDQR